MGGGGGFTRGAAMYVKVISGGGGGGQSASGYIRKLGGGGAVGKLNEPIHHSH